MATARLSVIGLRQVLRPRPPRVSTWTHGGPWKGCGKIPGSPKPRLAGLSLFRARNTSSDERRGKGDETARRRRTAQQGRVALVPDSTPIGLCLLPRETWNTCDVPLSPSGFPTEYIGRLAGLVL